MKDFIPRFITAAALVTSVCLAFNFLSSTLFALLLGVILIYILVVEWPRFNLWWLTPLYPVVPFLALIDLYLKNPALWAWLVIVVASYDTGGYIFGNLFGTHKIAPTISAGKTWQGLVGGVVFAGFMGVFAGLLLLKGNSYAMITLYLVSSFAGFLAFIGDLFESYLKRLSGLKDSGTLLPGHGGILDRIDGLLFTALVFNILLQLF
jgi:phosphatidate cytidylyltransferase